VKTLKELQKEVDEWIVTLGVRYFNPVTNAAILAEETGEVTGILARMYGEQSFKEDLEEEEKKEKLADELADVLFVLTCLANQTGIDLEQAFDRKMLKRTQRDKFRHKNNPKLDGKL